MPYDRSPDLLDKEVVYEFFWKFSVFECALKNEGFLKSNRDFAEADWDKFAQEISGGFGDVAIAGFQDALKILESSPPKKQVVSNGRLTWKETHLRNNETREKFALRLVKIVRNNLFHGGKYPDGPIEEISRNREILRAAMKVLEGCYELHPGIARRAEEAV